MSLYLDTRSKPSAAIGVCDRCHMKMAYSDMVPDPNSPGLRLHRHCADQFDPYRLPARATEDISLQYSRPDAPLD